MTTYSPLTLPALQHRANALGVTLPPEGMGLEREHAMPSGWSVMARDALAWIDHEHRANALMGPRAAATRRLRSAGRD